MALIDEGTWPCTIISADYGEDPERDGITRVQIVARIDSGPAAGRVVTYRDDVTMRSALYIGRSCRNVGWKGGDDLKTLKADCDAWIAATGGKALVEIKHIPIKNGKNAGGIWDKANAIKRAAPPLKAASATADADAREAMRAAMRDEGLEPPPAADNIPPPSDDDIPF